jgi:2-C-methyl-D-erythritol 4-phosphate cytidylyltransferase
VPAAGRGERLGAAVPKALVAVGGEPLLVRAVRGLLESQVVDAVVVAAPAEELDAFARAVAVFGDRCRVVPGGVDRTSSVRCALEAVNPGSFDAVLVHDAARAFTPVDVVHAVVEALAAGAQAVVPVIPVADTVKVIDAHGVITETPDRSSLRAIQTPQGFAEPVLRAAHGAGDVPNATLGTSNVPNSAFAAATDDAGLVERLGIPVHTVAGHPHALKITTPFDLRVAESILAGEP